ncbi:calcium-binding protein [Nocardioides sp.]|uniref:calcium-binding protein n=1 Tax=Nocardioides sp. TaxID=35761 RepID=UPI003784407A
MRLFGIVTTLFLVLVGGLTVAAGPAVAGHPPLMLGPGDAGVSGIGHEAIIRKSKYGYVYISGKHSSHLRIKYVERLDALRYRDTRTSKVRLPEHSCRREQVKTGISAVCTIPKAFHHKQMFVQVWPRLGNDYTDGSTLPHRFRLWVLTDAGNDVVLGGAGADFVNGAKGNDRMWGGPGNDWLRGGPGYDAIHAGKGHDRVAQG